MSFLEKEDVNLPVMLIVEDGGTEPAKFYMRQVGFTDFGYLEFLENRGKKLVVDELEYHSGTILSIVENRKSDCILYEGMEETK